jgi:isopentenyl-diphosphate Delta-isomerase
MRRSFIIRGVKYNKAMEYIDILDKDGNKTGITKTKLDVHKDGDWHRASHIWILNSRNELLIQRRSPTKENYPNLWDISVAGHISAGEDSIASALRESEEEIGVKLNREDFQYLFAIVEQVVLNNGTYTDNEIHDVYLVRTDLDISSTQIQEEEVAEIRFIDFRELEKMIATNADDFVPHQEEYKKLFEVLERDIE